jgi:hypothetical protein
MLREKYSRRGSRMDSSDIAIEEGCSRETAVRMMNRGEFGQIYARNKRVKWISVEGYCEYLSVKTVVIKASA